LIFIFPPTLVSYKLRYTSVMRKSLEGSRFENCRKSDCHIGSFLSLEEENSYVEGKRIGTKGLKV